MITRTQLEQIGRLKGINLGNTEKDYLLDIALLSISRHIKNELIFKGGTCLYKFHKLTRFSEDLDFSANQKIDIDDLIKKVLRDFENFGIKAHLKKKLEPFDTVLTTLELEGPLFIGTKQSHASIGIDINLKSKTFLEPELKTYAPIYQDIPDVTLLCMNPEEIFAEKIRALLTRKKARDLFDLHFLIKQNVTCSKELVNRKMEYYESSLKITELIIKIKELKNMWEKELKGFTTQLPNYDQASKEVIKIISAMLK
ncbi:nucleotidyl transferase AbiEii/AbiGii toxin family protein [Candidatus Woesearchaeota archaeon]|nr:nucleotidyl transferase AbiEii/AbiGii toxin family protein [Candidatus Woesearchaeota archaeon]